MARTSHILLGTAALTLSAAAFSAHADRLESPSVRAFLDAHPGAAVYGSTDRISRVYGSAFSHGASAEASAQTFIERHADLWGVQAADLQPTGVSEDGPHQQGISFDAQRDTYKFTGIYFEQVRGGLPVFRSRLVLLLRNEPGFPLVLAGANLHDLGAFEPDVDIAAQADAAMARRAVRRLIHPQAQLTELEPVIWAGVSEDAAAPRVAITFIADYASADPTERERWRFVIDALTGETLLQESEIHEVDVVGNVSGMATQGNGADICGPEAVEGMPYALVRIGNTTAFADVNGDFVIPNGGGGQVTVESALAGQWFTVNNISGPDALLQQTVNPPGPANFLHNDANDNEFERAEVNAYLHANVVRDYTLRYNPSYPTIHVQESFPVNVNIDRNCNAYYDGSSINFYTSGGCANTAFSTVVHHEYGHHLVAVGGSGQAAYGEGMSDAIGVLITDEPELGIGFGGNCNQPLRNADNSVQYPCFGGSHSCGRLISGCVWDLRQELIVTEPSAYRDILSSLTINSILLHVGGGIDPAITIDFMTLDDDDGNLTNGSPHYAEIAIAFGRHNMAPVSYPLPPESFTVPFGQFISGDLDALKTSDNDYVEINQRPAFAPTLPVARLEVDGTIFSDQLVEFVFQLEASASAMPPTVPQHVEFFNYDAAGWELVATGTATTFDGIFWTYINTNTGRFVESGSLNARTRVSWFEPGNVFSPSWGVKIDQAVWRVRPGPG